MQVVRFFRRGDTTSALMGSASLNELRVPLYAASKKLTDIAFMIFDG